MDWNTLARLLLDRSTYPQLILDPNQRVVAVNREFQKLLGWNASLLERRDFVELCVLGPEQARVRQSLQHAALVEVKGLEFLCHTPHGQRQRLLVEASPAAESSLLLTVLDARPEFPDAPCRPAAGNHYEISIRTSNFGVVRRLFSAMNDPPADWHYGRCHVVFHGRPSPCERCPAVELSQAPPHARKTTVMYRAHQHLRLALAAAEVTEPGFATVSVWEVDEPTLHQLMEAKIRYLSEQSGLSERERSVLELMLLGRSIDDIATVLQLAPRTVKYHTQRILSKLGADSRQDLPRLLL